RHLYVAGLHSHQTTADVSSYLRADATRGGFWRPGFRYSTRFRRRAETQRQSRNEELERHRVLDEEKQVHGFQRQRKARLAGQSRSHRRRRKQANYSNEKH